MAIRNISTQSGLTLVEVMITLSVMAILAAISAPSFNGVLASSQQVSTRDELLNTIAFARSEAVTRGTDIIICAKAENSYSCSASTDIKTSWQHGWLVFQDSNGDANASNTEILQTFDAPNANIAMNFSGSTAVTFNHRGRLSNAGTHAARFTLSSEDTSKTNSLELRPTGRVRICDDWQTESSLCTQNS